MKGQQSLEDEYQRDPLVVTDQHLILLLDELLARYCLVHRQIIRVTDPTYGVRIVPVTVCELGRTPARDGPAHELLRAD